MISAIIQARMGSSRLPGKILQDIDGTTMLEFMVARVRRARTIDEVVVATTTDPKDDPVVALCAKAKIPCTRGSESDVLSRYAEAARSRKSTVVVRLTADCPLIDPAVIDRVVDAFRHGDYDYAANTAPPEGSTWPDGMDTEVFSARALERAHAEATLPSEREHVTFHFWKNPTKFRTHRVDHERQLGTYRLTVDKPEDLEVVRAVVSGLKATKRELTLDEVVRFLDANPTLRSQNSHIATNSGWATALEADRQQKSPRARSLDLQRRARARIPGVSQLLSKRPEMFAPGQWPGYYSRACGAEVWDLDGNKYVDMSISGIGANVLGYADPDVNAAVISAIEAGSSSSLLCPEDMELADLLCDLHPWAEMARFARSGGEAMAVAVRIARAHTRRSKVAFCGYHGWMDWYLAANLSTGDMLEEHLLPGLDPGGVPKGLAGTALPFSYNRIDELEKIVREHGSDIGAIVLEPVRDRAPDKDFLPTVREIANKIGAVMVIDEITAALRLNSAGAHLLYGVEPDIAVFAKAIGNGFPIAAIIGRAEVMQSSQTTFISSTNWTERVGPTAALATIRKHRRLNVSKHLIEIGNRVQAGWNRVAAETSLKIHVSGIAPLSHFNFEDKEDLAMRTLFVQEMLDHGFLASGRFYASYAHTAKHVDDYMAAALDTFRLIADAKAHGAIDKKLRGPVMHSGFRRLT